MNAKSELYVMSCHWLWGNECLKYILNLPLANATGSEQYQLNGIGYPNTVVTFTM